MRAAITLIALLLVGQTQLPDAKVGKPYSASIGDNLSGCRIETYAFTSRRGDVSVASQKRQFQVSATGEVSGTPIARGEANLQVRCNEANGIFSITVE